MSGSGTLYKRKASLIVANETSALDLSAMQFTFHTYQSDLDTPNNVIIRVYNLKPSTIQAIKEFDRVVLSAGYQDGPFGVIFDGEIKQQRSGRENQLETYTDILAADGDAAFNFAVVNKTLSKGSKIADQVNVITAEMAKGGVTKGYLPEFVNAGNPALIRGKVMYGLARDYARNIANGYDARWSIQQKKFIIIPNASFIPGPPIEINSASGMIGIPEQTQDGIKAKALINPNFQIGQSVKINNADIQNQKISIEYGAINLFPSKAADGQYRVIVAEFYGNTRGPDWYADLICLSIDPSSNPSSSVNPWPDGN